MELQKKLMQLSEILRTYGRVIIAYSGGVDSTFLIKVAYDTLGLGAIAVTSISESYPESEFEETKKLAKEIGIKHIIIKTEELTDRNYSANQINRCYFCKNELYAKIKPIAEQYGIKYILDGLNLDDIGDIRPGIRAAKEHGIISPLKVAGLTKNEIRELSKLYSLSTWDKPASPCLSSRVEYGILITADILRQIEACEKYLKDLGINNVRVRYHRHIARIESDLEDFGIILRNRDSIISKFKELGFIYIALDLQGFRSGSMNELLNIRSKEIQR